MDGKETSEKIVSRNPLIFLCILNCLRLLGTFCYSGFGYRDSRVKIFSRIFERNDVKINLDMKAVFIHIQICKSF